MRPSLLYVVLSFLIACPSAFSQHLAPIPDRGYFAIPRPPIMVFSSTGEAGLSLVPLDDRDDQGSLALTIGSSAVLGAAGFFVGGFVGSALADDCGWVDCIEPVIFGVLIGTPVGTAVGAHIGNGRRGSLGYDLLAGLAGTVGGGLMLAASSGDQEVALLLAGASVVALPVLVERRTAAQNARAKRVAVAAAPMPNGFHVGLRVAMGG